MKLIFYLILMIVWIVSNLKKQEKAALTKKFTEPVIPLRPKGKPHPAINDIPLREGDFSENAQFKQNYAERQAAHKQKFNTLKQKSLKKMQPPQMKTKKNQAQNTLFPEADLFSLTEKSIRVKKTVSSPLKSSLKEGIMWSIILGPPRAKLKHKKQIT